MTHPRVPTADPMAVVIQALFGDGDVEAMVADSLASPALAGMRRDFDDLAVRPASEVSAERLAAGASLNRADRPLGRHIRGGEAVSLVRRDAPLPATPLAELRGIAHGEDAASPPFGAAPDA